jgi:hypothetical protein
MTHVLLGKSDPPGTICWIPESEWSHTVNITDLACAKLFMGISAAIGTIYASPFGANGSIFGAGQALHAFGVDDVAPCS